MVCAVVPASVTGGVLGVPSPKSTCMLFTIGVAPDTVVPAVTVNTAGVLDDHRRAAA